MRPSGSRGADAQIAQHEGSRSRSICPRRRAADHPDRPGRQGRPRTGALKPATLQTGVVVQVPLFVEEGERIKVDTRSGEYIERVKA